MNDFIEKLKRSGFRRHIPIIAFIIVIAVVPQLFGSPYVISTLAFIGYYSITALGLTLLLGHAGQISLGQGAFVAVGAYTSAILTTEYNLSPWAVIFIGALLSGCIAALIGFPMLRLAGHMLAVATIAFNIITNVLSLELESLTGGYVGISRVPRLSIGSWVLDDDIHYCYLFWAVVVLILIFSSNILRSRVGRALRSLHHFAGGSETAAESLSISPMKYKVQIFVVSAVYASLAGSLYAHYLTYVNPSPFNVWLSIRLLMMIVIGGITSFWGAILGAAVLMFLGELLREFVPRVIPGMYGEFEVMFYGIIFVLMLMYIPRGLAPTLARYGTLTERIRSRLSRARFEEA